MATCYVHFGPPSLQSIYRQIPRDLAMATMVYAPQDNQGRLGFDVDPTGVQLLQELTAEVFYFDHYAHQWKPYPTQSESLIQLLRKHISPSILAAPQVIQQHQRDAEAFEKARKKFALSMRYGLTPAQWQPTPGAITLFNEEVGLLEVSADKLVESQIDVLLDWRHGEFGLHAYACAADPDMLKQFVDRLYQVDDVDVVTHLREEDFPRW